MEFIAFIAVLFVGWQRKMKRAPIFPKDEMVDCNELGYDPQLDFSKVLEEARKHANDVKFSLSPSNSTEKKVEIEVTKSKRSWRRSLSLWFKQDKKSSKQSNATETKSSKSSRVPTRKDGPVSALLFGDGGKLAVIQRSIRRSASGPLANCFIPTRTEENEVPYMCLDQQSRPSGVQAFGPIYLVT